LKLSELKISGLKLSGKPIRVYDGQIGQNGIKKAQNLRRLRACKLQMAISPGVSTGPKKVTIKVVKGDGVQHGRQRVGWRSLQESQESKFENLNLRICDRNREWEFRRAKKAKTAEVALRFTWRFPSET